METFRFLLFGFAGVSVVFWVAIIALWHTYMFPRFFDEDKGLNTVINQEIKDSTNPILGSLVNSNNFRNRQKYSMKNLVIADFSSTGNNFKLNKIYIKKISKYRNPKKYTLNKSINHCMMLLMIRDNVIRSFSLNIS